MPVLKKDSDVRDMIFDALRRSVARSKFAQPEVRNTLNKLIARMDADLERCYWSPEQGESSTEEAASKLYELLDALDQADSKDFEEDAIPEKSDLVEVDEDEQPEITEVKPTPKPLELDEEEPES